MRKAWKRLVGRAGAATALWSFGTLALWASLALAGPGWLAGTAGAGFLAGVALGCLCGSIVMGVAVGDAAVDVWDGRRD